jgi:hypothetical protein
VVFQRDDENVADLLRVSRRSGGEKSEKREAKAKRI